MVAYNAEYFPSAESYEKFVEFKNDPQWFCAFSNMSHTTKNMLKVASVVGLVAASVLLSAGIITCVGLAYSPALILTLKSLVSTKLLVGLLGVGALAKQGALSILILSLHEENKKFQNELNDELKALKPGQKLEVISPSGHARHIIDTSNPKFVHVVHEYCPRESYFNK